MRDTSGYEVGRVNLHDAQLVPAAHKQSSNRTVSTAPRQLALSEHAPDYAAKTVAQSESVT